MFSRTLVHRLTLSAAAVAAVVLVASSAVAQNKVLRVPMTTNGPGTLDPISGSTTYDNRASSCVYETLLDYKYLMRPLQLEPLLLAEMPDVSSDGLTWRFKLTKGILFHDDACFEDGKGREMVASDVIYSWRRLADPKFVYKSWWLVDGLIKGFNEYKDEQAVFVQDGKKFDYDAPVEGFEIINDYEFVVRLNVPNQQFIWRLAMFQLAVVPHEAIEKYGSRFSAHPVGTGPFVLRKESDWTRNASITFHRNPNYREAYYPSEWMPEDEEAGLHKAAGQRVPIVDQVEMHFFVESQPAWLEFKAGRMDFTTVPQFGFREAFSQRTKELKRGWTRKGISMVKVPLLDFIFRAFNMEDEFLGGYTDEKRALRQAFNLAMDWDEMNEAMYFGMALPYDGPIPPAMAGHPYTEDHRAPFSTRGADYARAREKLIEAGYEIDAQGKVIGMPVIDMYTSAGAESERIVGLMQRNLEEVGIRLNPRYQNFSVLMDQVDQRRAPFFSFAWGSDYPDAENNLALFYSPNASPGANHSNYNNPEYDRLYRQIQTMPDSPERTTIYERMRDMLIKDAPFCGSLARTRVYLIQPWTKNFKPTESFFTYFKYLDVDMDHDDRDDN